MSEISFGKLFGELVLKKRTALGVSQQWTAVKAFGDEASKKQISRLENGHVADPHATTVQALSVALNITPEELEACYPAPPPPTDRRFDLPPVPDLFVGRVAEEAALLDALRRGDSRAIVGLKGVGGIGKSALASKVARQLTDTYPDGAVSIDLQGVSQAPLEPTDAMGRILLRLNPAQKLPDDAAHVKSLYDQTLQNAKLLIILDNARDGAQVKDLLPPPPSAAIITARRPLALPGVPQGAVLNLDNLAREEATALLRNLLPDAADAELDALAEACRDHPLALQAAGATLATYGDHYAGVADYIAEIETDRTALRLEGHDDHDVMAVLGLSLRVLTADDPDLVEQWRDLTAFVGRFQPVDAAAVLDLPERATQTTLRRLGIAGFLEAERGVWRFHDLMRDLARLEAAPDRLCAAETRHGAYFRDQLSAADDQYKAGSQVEALSAYDAMAAEIAAAQSRAAEGRIGGPRFAFDLYHAGVHLFHLRLPIKMQIIWLEAALASARAAKHRQAEENALNNLGVAHWALGDPRRAIEHHEQQLAITREISDRHAEGAALSNLGLAHAGLSDLQRAIELYEQALIIMREIGDQQAEGSILGNLGLAHADLGDLRQAIEFYEQHLAITREIGDRAGEGRALGNLGVAYKNLGEPQRAIEFYEQHLVIAREIGDRRGEGTALHNLGIAHQDLGDVAAARACLQAALVIFTEIESPYAEESRKVLADLPPDDGV